MPQQSNILLIMADQLMPFLTGAYGHPVVKTPHLDALVARGVRFDAAYTPYPLCAPARAAFMTGRYASELGCYDNAAVLHADEPTVAHYLTNAGYETVLSGKMHFIGPDQCHGFRHRLTTDVFPANIKWVPAVDEAGNFPLGGHAHNYVPPNVGVRTWTKFLSFDEETHFRALEYLYERGRSEPAEPFFLVVSYHHPHDPFHVTQELWDLYEGADIAIPDYPEALEAHYSAMDRWVNEVHQTDEVAFTPENLRALRRAYYGLVTYIDRKVGSLLAALEETAQHQNTIIIFTSDHGDMLAEKRMVQKRCFYEWSVRIPLVIRFPDDRFKGTTVRHPVSLLDLTPTMLDLTTIPAEGRLPMDGTSLLPLMTGEQGAGERPVFSEYHVEKVRAPCFMVRQGRYKYIYVHGYDRQLFDLEADPHEWHNLVGQPKMQMVEEALYSLVVAQFDPDKIEADGAASVRRRDLIRQAMERNDVHWDYFPYFDATRQFVR